MLQFVAMRDWDLKMVAALNESLKEEFSLDHDIRWIGIIEHKRDPDAARTDSHFTKRSGVNLAFLVHKDDLHRMENGHRLDLSFRWFFDVVGQGDSWERRFPRTFIQTYR